MRSDANPSGAFDFEKLLTIDVRVWHKAKLPNHPGTVLGNLAKVQAYAKVRPDRSCFRLSTQSHLCPPLPKPQLSTLSRRIAEHGDALRNVACHYRAGPDHSIVADRDTR
jgi:hypothetical protein